MPVKMENRPGTAAFLFWRSPNRAWPATRIAGCASPGATTSGTTPGRTAGPVAKVPEPGTWAQAVSYGHAVNLRAGDVPGFSASESEAEGPKPGPASLEGARCTGALDPRRRTTAIDSRTLEAGRARSARFIRSRVEVWPTHADVIFNSSRAHTKHGRSCLTRVFDGARARVNRKRHGAIGPFRIASIPISIPGLERSYLTSINETRLRRSGAVLIHIYRDLFVFISGPAEVELEAVGFNHPLLASTEKHALEILASRARANARSWR
jgi:hypothetical protein